MKSFIRAVMGCLFLFMWGNQAMAVEEPRYQVIKSDGSFEIRVYPPLLIAQTVVTGNWDEASSKGFRLLADYIFGNNQNPDDQDSGKIAMTAPVSILPQITAEGNNHPFNFGLANQESIFASNQLWRVTFVMPHQYTMKTIPQPRNPAIQLIETPIQYFVVNRYSGLNGDQKVEDKIKETQAWAKKHSLTLMGPAQLSRYNPPWTLPIFKRNEIMIQVNEPLPIQSY